MKYRDLVRRLKQLGYVFLKEGTNYEMWWNGIEKVAVPRHTKVSMPLARRILSKARKT